MKEQEKEGEYEKDERHEQEEEQQQHNHEAKKIVLESEHESVCYKPEELKENEKEEEEEDQVAQDEMVAVQECNIATAADTTLVSDYSGEIGIEEQHQDIILEKKLYSSQNQKEFHQETTEKEEEKTMDVNNTVERDLLDLNNEDKMEYISDVQDRAKELVENSVTQDVDLIGQYDNNNNNNFRNISPELPIPEPESRFSEMQEPLEQAVRADTSSSSTKII